MRAARAIQHDASLLESTAEIIDRETGMRELIDLLEQISPKPAILWSGAARNLRLLLAPLSSTAGTGLPGAQNNS